MNLVPSSVITAVALSAAAGKNPWIPLGLLFLVAAPAEVPAFMMEPSLHAQLHSLAPAPVLWTLGGVFGVLAVLESLADKIPFVERWLVPVSTAWRPFAGVAVSAIIGFSAAGAATQDDAAAAPIAALHLDVVAADMTLVGGSLVALCIVAGALYGWIATIAKTGTRLLLSLVPLPALRLVHSFVDDFFALAATFAGLAFAASPLVLAAAILYLVAGLITAPLLGRLAWIHMRIGWALVRKGWRKSTDAPAPAPLAAPKWLARALKAEGIDPASVTLLSAYTYRAPEIGWCRDGLLVFAPDAVLFATRAMFRTKLLKLPEPDLARIALAQTTTARSVAIVDRTSTGALRECVFHLFPAEEREVVPVLAEGAARVALVRVKVDSESARRALPGFAQRGSSVRYLPADRAGSLHAQAITTIAGAVILGVLSAGTFVPIGLGYAISPYKRRFVLGLLVSAYLGLCVLGSMGFGWPAAVIYATLLNVLALRDLARCALKARVDGFVDKRAFLPLVADRAWIPERTLATPADRWHEGDPLPITDGTWRSVVELLKLPASEAADPGPMPTPAAA